MIERFVMKRKRLIEWLKAMLIVVAVPLILLGVPLVLVSYFSSPEQPQSSGNEGAQISDEDIDKFIAYYDAVLRRKYRIKNGLSIDDPNCDPNNFPMPDFAKSMHPGVQESLYINSVIERRKERITQSEEDPNYSIISLP